MKMPNLREAASQPATTSAPVLLPQVNLLPPEIAEAARFRRFQLAMGGAGLAAVAVVAALGVSAHHSVNAAQSELVAVQSQQTQLQSQLTALQSVKDVYTQVAAKKQMLTQAMGSEIRWSYYLTDLSLKVPDHVWLTNVSATETPPTAAAAPAVGAATGAVGTVTFTGVAYEHDDVATWLDTLAKERGFSNAYFTNSTKAKIGEREVVDFSSSVSLTSAALSGRYSAVEG